jgi:hypothetical protein
MQDLARNASLCASLFPCCTESRLLLVIDSDIGIVLSPCVLSLCSVSHCLAILGNGGSSTPNLLPIFLCQSAPSVCVNLLDRNRIFIWKALA